MSAHRIRRPPLLAAFTALTILAIAAPAGAGHPGRTRHRSWDSDGDRNFRWALVDPSRGSIAGATDGDDWIEIERLDDSEQAPVLWVRADGRAWIMRDPAWVGRARELLAPVAALGKRQGELGRRQGELGERQSRLGREQGDLGRRQAELSVRLSRTAMDASANGSVAARREQREIETRMRELGEAQGELGQRQASLGEAQAELGRAQAELGQEQARESKKAGVALKALFTQARRAGKVEEANPSL